MGIFDIFRRKRHPSAPRPAADAFVLTLDDAPSAPPIPIITNDPMDRMILALWEQFQREHPMPNWRAFLDWLATANRALDEEIRGKERDFAQYPSKPPVKP
jgi:hypothetical protein